MTVVRKSHQDSSRVWFRSLVLGASALSLGILPAAASAQPLEDAPTPTPVTATPSQDSPAGDTGTTPPGAAPANETSTPSPTTEASPNADASAATVTPEDEKENAASSAGEQPSSTAPAQGEANAAAPSSNESGAATHAPIISPARAADGEVMNYAVNLAPEATPAQLAQLVEAAKSLGAAPLAQYPELDAFFVQSAKAAFASDIAQAAQTAGIPVHSVGPTRFAQVSGEEIVVPGAVANSAAGAGTGAAEVKSQLDDYVPDPRTGEAWGLTAIGAVEANTVDVPRSKVTVAVLDTGIDGAQPDLVNQIDVEKSVGCHVNGIANNAREAWQDDHYHGTHVAGTIAAEHNAVGVDGVAPQATLMAVKVSNSNGSFYPEYVTCGIMWSLEKGADITNNSYYVDPWAFWLPKEPSQAAGYEVVRRAFEYTDKNGLLNVVAAGNADYNLDSPTTDSESPNDVEGAAIANRDVSDGGMDIPSMLENVVTVSAVALPKSATNPAEAVLERASFSNYGDRTVEIAAPGQAILSTIPLSRRVQWAALSGTSMASPHVAGVAALLKSIHSDAKAPQLRELLYKHAATNINRLAPDAENKAYRGRGLVDALAAVTKDQPKPVIGAIEYSIDGNTWQPLGKEYNVNVSPKARLRVTVSGPATAASLEVYDFPVVSVTSDNAFGSELTLTTEELPLADALSAHDAEFLSIPVTVRAEGRNKDARADDDVVKESKLPIVKAEVVPHPEELKVEVSAPSVTPGAALTFLAAGFAVGEEVTFRVYSDPVVVGTAAADAQGRASIEWTVPADFAVGTHTVKALGTSGREAEQSFEVKAVDKPQDSNNSAAQAPSVTVSPATTTAPASGSATKSTLASTGSQAMTLVALALLAAVAGAVGVRARKRS